MAEERNTWKIAVFCRFRPSVDRTDMALSKEVSAAARGRLNGHGSGRDSLVEYSVDPRATDDGVLRHGLDIRVPPDADPGLFHNNPSGSLRFEFDRIFDAAASQETIFDEVAKDKIFEVFLGINCTIFAYGQTGSGKTFTVSGGDDFQQRGLIPRTIGCIFEEVTLRAENKTHDMKCHISFAEVYKENVYDLLDPQQRELPIKSRAPVQVLESEGGLVMKNISVYEVTEEKDALSLFFMGIANRISDSTMMNSVSSRSHAIFTIIVDSESLDEEGRSVFTSGKINLVDLAGSERMYKMHNTKGMITEAKSINLSLHYLEKVIVSLRCISHGPARQPGKQQPGVSHVPYRNSVLTNILRDSLGGNCKSCFILTLSLERLHFEETVSTCRFGQRCGEVKVQVAANSELSLTDQLRDQTTRAKQLEKQVLMLDDQRLRALEALEMEKGLRSRMCELRALTEAEEEACKLCVDDLLAAAKKASGSSLSQSGLPESPSAAAANRSLAILDQSQDAFFQELAGMDKAVVVELCAALASLLQTVFVDREKIKFKEQTKTKMIQARVVLPPSAADNRMESQHGSTDSGSTSPKKAKPPIETMSAGNNVEAMFSALLTRGEYFVKTNRYGIKCVRHVAVSSDFGQLYWHHMGNLATPTTMLLTDFSRYRYRPPRLLNLIVILFPHHLLLVCSTLLYENNCRVEISGKTRSVIVIHGKPGKRTLSFEYVNGNSLEETWAIVSLWFQALNSLLVEATGEAGADSSAGSRVVLSPRTLAKLVRDSDGKLRVRDPADAVSIKNSAMKEWVNGSE